MLMPNEAVARALTLWRRRHRARRLGFFFRRASGFEPPPAIPVGSEFLRLSLPADTGSRNAFVDVLLDDCYRLERLPADIHSVVDVGAHAGLFSIAVRRRWPDAVIHAYEPNPAMRPHLESHSSQARIQLYQEAVGATAGCVTLVSGADSVHTRTVASGDGIVQQVSLSQVLARLGGSADLVKLDCEGAEWETLADLPSWRNVRFLTMEFHLWAGYTLRDLEERIRNLGFTQQRSWASGKDFGLLLASR